MSKFRQLDLQTLQFEDNYHFINEMQRKIWKEKEIKPDPEKIWNLYEALNRIHWYETQEEWEKSPDFLPGLRPDQQREEFEKQRDLFEMQKQVEAEEYWKSVEVYMVFFLGQYREIEKLYDDCRHRNLKLQEELEKLKAKNTTLNK